MYFHQLTREMRGGAITGVAERQLARLRTRRREQIGQRIDRRIGLHQEQVGRRANQRDRREIGERIVGQLVVKVRVERVPGGDNDQRVAVRRRLGQRLRCNRAARTGAVLDDDCLAPAFGQLIAQRAPDNIDSAAWRERHVNVHRLRREIVLRSGHAANRRKCQGQNQHPNPSHFLVSLDGHGRHYQRPGGEQRRANAYRHMASDGGLIPYGPDVLDQLSERSGHAAGCMR